MRVAVLMLGAFAALTAATGSAHAQGRSMGYGLKPIPGDTGPKEPEGVAFTQNLGESVPTDLEFYERRYSGRAATYVRTQRLDRRTRVNRTNVMFSIALARSASSRPVTEWSTR